MAGNESNSIVKVLVNGRPAEVPQGITVAAALFNLDVSPLRRSVTNTPRGVLCGMGVCFECRVTVDGAPHQRACLALVANGMRIDTHGNA